MEEEYSISLRPRRDKGARMAIFDMPMASGMYLVPSALPLFACIFALTNRLHPSSSSPFQFKREKTTGDYSVEKLILGTHTSDGEQNHLMIAEARIPNENAEIDGTKYHDREGGEFISYALSKCCCHLVIP